MLPVKVAGGHRLIVVAPEGFQLIGAVVGLAGFTHAILSAVAMALVQVLGGDGQSSDEQVVPEQGGIGTALEAVAK